MAHSSLLERKIIHVDMDAFYASIEVRDNPELQGKPVAVGGHKEGRGVIATCSYEARKFGVRSAMATALALKKCPDLVLVSPRFQVYRGVSKQLRAIFREYTDKIEPLSLDEAFLDVTHLSDRTATKIALEIKEKIFQTTSLTASTGVAPNKMIAKIASDIRKPDGITVVTPELAFPFMQVLSVSKIPGIGPKSAERLKQHGISICADVLKHSQVELRQLFGIRMGDWLFNRAQGIDEREVEEHRGRKSLGAERTFSSDLLDLSEIKEQLDHVLQEVVRRIKEQDLVASNVTLKVKYADFKLSTRSLSLPSPTDKADILKPNLEALMSKTKIGEKPIRLIGVSLSALQDKGEAPPYQQPLLF